MSDCDFTASVYVCGMSMPLNICLVVSAVVIGRSHCVIICNAACCRTSLCNVLCGILSCNLTVCCMSWHLPKCQYYSMHLLLHIVLPHFMMQVNFVQHLSRIADAIRSCALKCVCTYEAIIAIPNQPRPILVFALGPSCLLFLAHSHHDGGHEGWHFFGEHFVWLGFKFVFGLAAICM